jgi:hypothetical protein
MTQNKNDPPSMKGINGKFLQLILVVVINGRVKKLASFIIVGGRWIMRLGFLLLTVPPPSSEPKA